MNNLIIGSHVSFKQDTQLLGSVEEALSYNANALMIYTGAPQNTLRKDINEDITFKAHELIKKNNIDMNNIIVHAPYIINLANPKNIDFNIDFLSKECARCKKLGINKMVLHPGSHVGYGIDEGIKTIVDALEKVDDSGITILLETMAGKGSECASTIDELKKIIDSLNNKEIGVCIDTCHINDAGYDIKQFDLYLEEFDKKIGIDKIGCIHINDSKNNLGSHKDRHDNIGFGTIGFDNLLDVIYNERLINIPKILETPFVDSDSTHRAYPPYKFEIKMIKNKKFDTDLINKIKNFYK